MAYAHSKNTAGQRHDLVEHLRSVAALAREFAEPFGGGEAAYYAGLWHDLGKFHPEFQDYLVRSEADPKARGHGPDHKAAGASLAQEYLPLLGLLLQGHHGGLRNPALLNAWLKEKQANPATGEALVLARTTIPDLVPNGRIDVPSHARSDRHAAELFLRLVFSALADADFLDTESHFRDDKTAIRGSKVTLEELWQRFQTNQAALIARASGSLTEIRAEIYRHCIDAAEQASGFFRLTVPTGGGKTRSGMAFALRHALKHGLGRVVVAVPFISITDQTASVYRDIFGDEDGNAVLEHHSMADTGDDESGDFHTGVLWDRLAAENWDAPVVVTTTVQLLESLFSNMTSRTRKLHRLAGSVIVLDEAQTLPPHLLLPILDVLRELVTHYGATVVISTATQPAFDTIPAFRTVGAEIVPEPARYFEALRRVEYEWRTETPVTWDEVASWLKAESQALAVVNTKKDALSLLDALGDPEALHLSRLLNGVHRRDTIEEVKRRLAAGMPCRLVSTQVIEAGVDLDFPLVLRALAPLDSIIQAAGRCNREGELPRPGRVVVFSPQGGGIPQGAYRIGSDQTARLVIQSRLVGTPLDPGDLARIRTYYTLFLGALGEQGLDRDRIQPLRSALDYSAVAQAFRMVDEDSYDAVITAYGDEEKRRRIEEDVERLANGGPDARFVRRRLQPFVVALRRREALRHLQSGLLQELRPGIGVWRGSYDSVRGFSGSDPDPEYWVV